MSDNKTKKKTSSAPYYNPQRGGLRERLARVKRSRWIRFGIVTAIFLAWVVWMGNPWLLLLLPLLADIYLTQFIPWTWWKGLKNPVARTLMSWVDAIVYALVLVYFLFLFVGQNYQIPSSSLEKTLLTGDFLWVNKMVYGPRVPQTPIHFPLAQNMLPFFNCKSYIETPQLDYHRLKGLRNVERGDIVVFNFPAGDTVAMNMPNPDYYTLCYELGREAVWANKARFGEIIYRPVDRRDNYVKRCIGLPGDSLRITEGVIYINGKALPEPDNVQFRYVVSTTDRITDEEFDELGVSADDRNGGRGGYELPLTHSMVEALKKNKKVTNIERVTDQLLQERAPQFYESSVMTSYPVGVDLGWTPNNYGTIYIPKRGGTVSFATPEDMKRNLALYRRCITTYEGNSLEVKNGQVIINGQPATSYTFKMDYYWMMGDNRDNSLDSRYWGFVPEDHIVGTPMVVLISFDKDHTLFDGWIRGSRIFKTPNPDKASFQLK